MKLVSRLLTILLFLAGVISLVYLSIENSRLVSEVTRMESELGKLTIKDVNQVYLAEINAPEVPPEIAPHVQRIWQFRCYLPAKYEVMRLSGSGRVTAEGLYQTGGYGSSWSMAQAEPVHELLTVSIQKKADRLEIFYSFTGSSGTISWNELKPERISSMVIQKLVSSRSGPRSFDQKMIMPLLKIYDPATAETTEVTGRSLTTYVGGQFVLCPKSAEPYLDLLRAGKMPLDFDVNSIAKAMVDE